MSDADLKLVARWRVLGTTHEVADVLGDVSAFAHWWPSVYLGLEVRERGDVHGRGTVACVCTRGWLLPTLLWQFRIAESRYPRAMSVEAWGDVVGRGTWTFEQDGPHVNALLDWSMRVDCPMARCLTPFLKPIIHLNQRWAMARGEEGLGLEVARRRLSSRIEPSGQAPVPPSCRGDAASGCTGRSRMLDEW